MNAKDKTIVLDVAQGDSEHDFVVAKDHALTLVVIADHVKKAQTSVRVKLVGRGAMATIVGIIVGDHDDQVSMHTMQIHAAPDTTSDLLVKTVLSGKAKSIYDGGIFVEKNAQKTNAYQRNENLLLSSHAYAESKPSLEILANDVRCTHGATAGPISDEQLWYLASRGIDKKHGEALVTQGFIHSALERVRDMQIRAQLMNRFTTVADE